MSVVLGLNAFHAGASATLVIDGEVVFAIAEERLNRVKYFAGFPALAIRACLDHAGIDFSEVDHVAVGRDSRKNLHRKLGYAFAHPLLLGNLLKIRASREGLGDLRRQIAELCGTELAKLTFSQVNVEHHLAHTASAFFVSGWEDAAGITIDGSGDFVTCMLSRCRGRQIEPVHRIYVPDSLGSFYTMICQFIGYAKYGDEGKVMGLAPLGGDRYREEIEKMIVFDAGKIRLGSRYFRPFGHDQGLTIDERGEMEIRRHYTDALIELFGDPREPHAEITRRDMDLAFGLQRHFEDIYFSLLNHLHELVPDDRVVMAGGCTLNSVANGKIFARTPFERTFIQPAAGDEGLAMGAALHVSHSLLGEGDNAEMTQASLGGGYSESRIESVLTAKGVRYRRHGRGELVAEAVAAIAAGKVLGWFQGRSEWGPRALGNRSILCHPGFPGMKDILNSRIKRREWFRPFAPAVLAERQSEVFEHGHPSPFMLHVYKIRAAWRERLSAVNHVDDTGRLQTVSREQNPLYYELIRAFGEKTGIPVLLNTSFNENEPIVERPEEAVDCFQRTRMDVLVIGPFIAVKDEHGGETAA